MTASSQSRRMSFDRNAVVYHEGRPPYPRRVYELLADEYGLGPGCRTLEVGAGSGIATAELLACGAHVTAVEPGAAFVGLLRSRHTGDRLAVVHSDLEHADLPPGRFDLAVAATSWHWVDPVASVPKVANVLVPAGGLAVWWTIFGDPDAPSSEFRAELEPLYARFLPHERNDGLPPVPMRVRQWQEQLGADGWFHAPQIEIIRWVQSMTAGDAQALWSTFPNIAELSDLDREAFLAGIAETVHALGGVVNDPRTTIVYHTRRT